MKEEFKQIYDSIYGTYYVRLNKLMALNRRMMKTISMDENDYYWNCATYTFHCINESLNTIKFNNYLYMGTHQFKKIVKRFQHICKNTAAHSYKQIDEDFVELYIDIALILDKKKNNGRMWINHHNTERELLRLFYEDEKCTNIIKFCL